MAGTNDGISVVIPTWNRVDLIRQILEGLARQTIRPTQILVMDNGSSDGTLEAARAAGAECVSFEKNLGFAVAINEGIRRATGDWILILNNDVVLAADWLEKLVAAAEHERALFAVGKLLRYDDPARIDGTWDLVCRAGCAWRCGHQDLDGPIWSERRRIQMAPMTAALFHRTVFERVGALETRFESYYEDVDFGIRCALAGIQGVYEPLAVAKHMGSATLGERSRRVMTLTARNQIYLMARHLRGRTLFRFAWAILIGHLLTIGVALKNGHLGATVRGKWQGILGLRRFQKKQDGMPSYSPEHVERVLLELERELFALQRRVRSDAFWKFYFALT